jgi:hypothetical protein
VRQRAIWRKSNDHRTTKQQNNMSEQEHGGPAFPTDTIVTLARASGREIENFPCSQGMSLRDWFAGKALQGMLSGTKTINKKFDLTYFEYSVAAWDMADAMLKARGK